MATGAVMKIMPKMVAMFMEGLMPIAEAAKEFANKRLGGRSVNIGMDAALTVSPVSFFIGSRSFNYGNIPNPVVPAAGYGSFIRQAATGYVLRFRNPAALPDPEAQVLQSSSKVFQYVLDR